MSNTNVLKKTLFLYPFCIKNKYFLLSIHLSNSSKDSYFYKGVVFLHGKVVSY